MAQTLLTERRDGGRVAVVTIDRQERRNAVDLATLDALADALRALTADEDLRVVVLTGAGGHFCAGADLTTVEDRSFAARVREVLDLLVHLPRPTVAAVDGFALGAGTQLAIACDLRVATPTARFGVPAGKLGLMVDHGTVQRLALVAGHGPARAILLAADTLDGEAAHRLGLVNRVGTLDDALAWAEEIAALAPRTLAGHKLMLNRLEVDLTAPAHAEGVDDAFRAAWGSEDLREGMAAFSERRAPVFRGR